MLPVIVAAEAVIAPPVVTLKGAVLSVPPIARDVLVPSPGFPTI